MIGFELEDDEDGSEPAPAVGSGCASLTAVDEDRRLDVVVAAVAKLRDLGALRVKVGDVEVQFAPPRAEPAVVARIHREVEQPPEAGDKRQAWRDTVRDKLANG